VLDRDRIMARIRHRIPARSAYTLLEMLIVLAALAVLTALTWPAVRGMLGKSELRDAAKQVRVALARARLEAIESGVPQRFRYATGAGRFEVGPLSTSRDDRGVAPQPARRLSRTGEPAVQSLPHGVWFVGPEVRQSRAESPSSREPSGEGGWSAPVVFHPNGRSNNARIQLAGPGGLYVEVALRGLTGTTKIGPIERMEESHEQKK
jgi:prepilin-type N-terminal cleavage/methylation domain-containing protein